MRATLATDVVLDAAVGVAAVGGVAAAGEGAADAAAAAAERPPDGVADAALLGVKFMRGGAPPAPVGADMASDERRWCE